MPVPKAQRDPFEVRLSDDKAKDLAQELSFEIDEAESARQGLVGDDQQIDTWHLLYEGGDGRITKNTPWPGAANLTSYIGTEKVDALRARIMATIFTEPIWIVEGWGEAAKRAAFVEQFHQWKAEEEKLQGYVGKAIHNALIEGTGVLEVCERAEWRRIRARIQAALQMDPMTGGPVMDPMTGLPSFQKDEQGLILPVGDLETASAATIVERYVRARKGPQYRVASLRDFLVLPGHAQDRSDIWGYAKKFTRRIGQLKGLEAQGIYRGVDQLGGDPERNPTAEETRAGQSIASQIGDRVEKELWEILFLKDLDGDGVEEWYLATLSRNKRVLLRLQRDDMDTGRFLLITPFPRSKSIYGYSFIGTKLGTIIDEHSGIRNMVADRSALANSAPIKRVVGALWDPYEQPFGPRTVIDVRDVKEVEAMQIPDVPGSVVEREHTVLAASERVSGLNDATLGVSPQANRTLGEYQNVVQQSFVRIDEIIRNVQEALEDLWTVRHQIWKRTLQDSNGEDLPGYLCAALTESGFEVPNDKATADMLEGVFRGKPHGSVETADLNKQRGDFIGFMQALAQLAQSVPGLQAQLSTPQAMEALLSQAMRVFKWQNKQAFVGNLVGPPGMPPPGMPQPPGMTPAGPPGGPPPGAPNMLQQLPALLAGRRG
jgi:hypothetical protein